MFEKPSALRERLAAALRERDACEARFDAIMGRSVHGILMVDDDGIIRYANRAAEKTFACAAGELLGKQCSFPIATDRAIELNIKSGSGMTVTVEVWGVAVEWEGKPARFVALNDVTERKRNDQELRKLYRAFMESPCMVIISNAAGTIEYVNPRFSEVTGYLPAEVIGKGHEILLSASLSPEETSRIRETLARGEDWRGEFVNWKKGGETYWESVSISPVRGFEETVTGFIAIKEDVTARKRMEEELRESEERFRATFNQAAVGIVHIALDGRWLRINRRFCEIVGYTEEELQRLTIHTITHPDDVATSMHHLQLLLDGEVGSYSLEKRYIRKDGSTVWVNLNVSMVSSPEGINLYHVGVIEDITARKLAEEAMRTSEEKFEKAFHAVPNLLVIVTLPAGAYVEVNGAFERACGYRRDELLGRTLAEIDIWADPAERERTIESLRAEKRLHDLECRFRRRSGDRFVGQFSAESLEICGVPCMIGIITDITGRKEAEERIETLNTHLAAHAAELEAVNRELEAFNYTVSHDLRRPLTNINSYCQVIQDQCGAHLGEQCREYLREIYEGTLRMNELIDTLLDFSRMGRDELSREAVDLSWIANAVAAELRGTDAGRRVSFRIAEGVTAWGDAKLLRVVLENLLGNAWKYSARRDEAVIEFGTAAVDGKPACFVRDNGTGFDMANAEKLFLPFQRLHDAREYRGHGIGLATVERIVRHHGGRVWAEGEKGKGATFWFTLPAA